MDSISAFVMGEANRGRELMVFDWNKAAQRIRETGTKYASAGLQSDWKWTGGPIYDNGIIPAEDTYVYLASTWATPELNLDGDIEDCYIMQSQVPAEWGDNYPHIYWPVSARAILEA